MLIPLSREKFEELVPLAATGAQYRYTWGSFSGCLQRLLVSFAAVIAAVIVGYFLGETFGPAFRLIAGIIAGCYWLWGPIFLASKRNWEYRQYKYSGFWRGEVLDKFVTDELVSTGETVNKRGELVVKENREKRLNLEIGDDTGFNTVVNVPLNRDHQSIRRGDAVEMVVVSSRPDLGRFAKISDVYVADSTVWVSDYPYVQRDAFKQVSQQLQRRGWQDADQRRSRSDNRYQDDRYREEDYRDEVYRDNYDRNRYSNPPAGSHYEDDRYAGDRRRDDRYKDDRYADNRYQQRRLGGRFDEPPQRDRYQLSPKQWDDYPTDRRSSRRRRRSGDRRDR
ncbi:MAG: phosphate ABC transporter permease [Cyanobacteria bacterium P01_F01_bin.150]